MRAADLAWTAGFLEGEGCFLYNGSARVSVSNTDREPLTKLRDWLGGSLTIVPLSVRKPRGHESPCYRWQLSGSQAAGLMMTIYSLMSDKRRRQIFAALSRWKLAQPHHRYRTSCKAGHPFSEANTYRFAGGRLRACRLCVRAKNARAYETRKAA